MITFLIYAAHIAKGAFWAAIVFIVLFFISSMALEDEKKKKEADLKKIEKENKEYFIAIVLLAIFCVLIPSEKTIYLMVAAHVAGKTDIPNNLMKVIENKLGNMVKDI